MSGPESDALSQINGSSISALNRLLEKKPDPEYGFPPALFEYEGKPYVLMDNGQVVSFWKGARQDWCKLNVTNPHEIQRIISPNAWPPEEKWAVETTTGKPQ
jgi:hypothetical protein